MSGVDRQAIDAGGMGSAWEDFVRCCFHFLIARWIIQIDDKLFQPTSLIFNILNFKINETKRRSVT